MHLRNKDHITNNTLFLCNTAGSIIFLIGSIIFQVVLFIILPEILFIIFQVVLFIVLFIIY